MRKFPIGQKVEELAGIVMPKCKLRWDRGSWWLGWMQLTFDNERIGDVDVRLDADGNIRVATEMLQRVIDARADPGLGSDWDRHRRVLVGLHDEVMPNVVVHCFCCWNHPSHDCGYLLKSKFSGLWEASSTMWDGDPTVAAGVTPNAAIEALWKKLSPSEDDHPPWAVAPTPPTH